MPSYRRIKVESPRQGIMKSSKRFDEEPQRDKHIKLDFIDSNKDISIEDNQSISLDNN
jgi:hypothetical protein